ANMKSAEAMNARAAVEVRRTEAVTLLKTLEEKCQQELGISPLTLREEVVIADDFDLDTARESVEEMRQRLDSFGAINMLA
ncbi:hypothetical protein OFM15_32950, partial [Escherichia coli]|nr:hypothetical protein [Escherichia coli]